jgi:D-alanyl-D-alanine carboxypeptidase
MMQNERRISMKRIRAVLLICMAVSGTLVVLGCKETSVSRNFSLTQKELRAMVAGLPTAVQEGIRAEPAAFFQLLAAVFDEPADLLVLVDKAHALSPDYVPPDLVDIAAYPLSVRAGRVLQLREAVMPAALAMAKAALTDGVALPFSSAYRSYETQRMIYAAEVQQYGQEMADRESARPGLSQHQLGTVVDFGSITDAFADTKAGKWLFAHAGEYGFSLSFPDGYEKVTGYRYESWHYRYITIAGTRLQRQFFSDIQQYLMEFLHAHRETLLSRRTR